MTEFDPQKRNASAFQQRLRRFFPERQLMIRTQGHLRAIPLTSTRQFLFSLVFLGLFGWLTYSTVVVIWLDEIISAKNAKITERQDQYIALLAEVGVYESQARDIRAQLESKIHGKTETASLGSAPSANTPVPIGARRESSAEENGFLAQQRPLSQEQDHLVSQLSNIEKGLHELSKTRVLLSDLENKEVELGKVVRQRDNFQRENNRLNTRVADLEEQVRIVEEGQMRLVTQFTELTETKISTLEKYLQDTGLDIKALLKRQEEEHAKAFGRGGPFMPLDLVAISSPEYSDLSTRLQDRIDEWAVIKNLSTRLPLDQPLKSGYNLTSSFGSRSDPFNGLAARHEGLDMGARTGTSIQATAPGKVTYAGVRGRYGRVVEIDHGMGLVTRYAHMDTISVQFGQIIKRGDKVGTVGNTGRSTGPHLHYEIRVNGRPTNPQIFIKAGKNVFEG